MALTYQLIQAITADGTSTTATFNSIPQTYTDLVLKMSLRQANAVTVDVAGVRFNGVSTGTLYSHTWLASNGTAPSSGRESNQNQNLSYSIPGSNSTASTFSNQEIYIPNYTGSANKVASSFGASENNATLAQMGALALLFRSTTAISSISVFAFGGNLVSGSTLYLYGIKNF